MKISVITSTHDPLAHYRGHSTHDPRHIVETWTSLRQQTHQDWEWVVLASYKSGQEVAAHRIAKQVGSIVENDPRVRIEVSLQSGGVGAQKKKAFEIGAGEILVELDHGDILVPEALAEIARGFSEPEIGFVYSDWADFADGDGPDLSTEVLSMAAWKESFAMGARGPRPPVAMMDMREVPDGGEQQGQPRTYVHPETRPSWIANGFRFYRADISGLRGGSYECVSAFSPSALAFSLIYFAPNHVRAWRREVYHRIGGHSVDFKICDDHELLIRTYLGTRVHHIAKPLYLCRYGAANTFDKQVDEIRRQTYKLHTAHFERLVRRQCFLEGRQAFELSMRPDAHEDEVPNEPGLAPWTQSSIVTFGNESPVGVIKADDWLAHQADKMTAMADIYRVLAPGGYLLSLTPSTDGRGAFMDPGHKTYWNELSFWYWTRTAQARFLRGEGPHPRFQEVAIPHGLQTFFPTKWHEDNKISYVRANLIALKDGVRWPGEVLI